MAHSTVDHQELTDLIASWNADAEENAQYAEKQRLHAISHNHKLVRFVKHGRPYAAAFNAGEFATFDAATADKLIADGYVEDTEAIAAQILKEEL
jgi:hypothetical protein